MFSYLMGFHRSDRAFGVLSRRNERQIGGLEAGPEGGTVESRLTFVFHQESIKQQELVFLKRGRGGGVIKTHSIIQVALLLRRSHEVLGSNRRLNQHFQLPSILESKPSTASEPFQLNLRV